jgi:type II secretory pathway component PulK
LFEDRISVGANTVYLLLEDEGSKVNVNSATEKLLLGLDLGRGQADSLLDWRDLDSDPRPLGAEEDYYLKQDQPLKIRDGLLPTKQELFLLRGWQDEERLISRHLTAWGQLNVNAMSYESLDALLASLDVDKFASQTIVNDFIVAKSKGESWLDLESFFGSLPSVGPLLGKKLEEHLTAEPQVNVNTATERVLLAWCHYLDLGRDLARWIVYRRESMPFADLAEILSRLPQDRRAKVPLFFTTQSSIFSLEARSGKVWIRAVVERRDEELMVLAWHSGNEGEDSDGENLSGN